MPNQFEETLRSVDFTIKTLHKNIAEYEDALNEFEKNCRTVLPLKEYLTIDSLLKYNIKRSKERVSEFEEYREELLEHKKVE